jgi:hypothetical protein
MLSVSNRRSRLRLEALEDRRTPALFLVNTTSPSVDHTDNRLSLSEAVAAIDAHSLAQLSPAELAQVNGQIGINDTIEFQVTGTIKSNGLALNRSMAILGPGRTNLTIDGQDKYTVFTVGSIPHVTISDLTIANGRGGITNNGSLRLANCTLSEDEATYGGGVNNLGVATLTNCTLSDDSANYGGGLANRPSGTATLINCTLSDNSGGAINNRGRLALVGCTLSGNTATWGGAIANVVTGVETLTNCTLDGNTATSLGGGIYNWGKTLLTNCTLYGNSAPRMGGGGIYNDSLGGHAFVALNNSILANSTSGGDVINRGWLSGSRDLVDDSTGLIGWFRGNPMLGPLQDNGGPTLTRALLPGSPAINAGNNNLVPAGITADQRGSYRFVGGIVDLGAYEY